MNITKRKMIIGSILIIVVMTFFFFLFPSKNITLVRSEEKESYASEALFSEVELSQEFSPQENYDGIAFYVGTYMKVFNEGKLKVQIEDSKDKVIYDKDIDMKTVVDSAAIYLKFKAKKDEKYKLTIQLEDIKEELPIVVYMTKEDKNPLLVKNGEEQEDSLDLDYFSYTKSYFNLWYIFLLGGLFYLYYLLNYSKEGGNHNEK